MFLFPVWLFNSKLHNCKKLWKFVYPLLNPIKAKVCESPPASIYFLPFALYGYGALWSVPFSFSMDNKRNFIKRKKGSTMEGHINSLTHLTMVIVWAALWQNFSNFRKHQEIPLHQKVCAFRNCSSYHENNGIGILKAARSTDVFQLPARICSMLVLKKRLRK